MVLMCLTGGNIFKDDSMYHLYKQQQQIYMFVQPGTQLQILQDVVMLQY